MTAEPHTVPGETTGAPAPAAPGPAMTARAEDPVTYAGAAPADLVGRTVRARPFYHRPVGPGSAASQQAKQCHTGYVLEVFGPQMVVVAFDQDAPGNARQAFFPRELHDPGACGCRACTHPAPADTKQPQPETGRDPAEATGTTPHTCNDGHGPYFGRLTDSCPRCEELKNGATPVRWRRTPPYPYQPHECTYRCNPVCTANDW